MESKLDHVLWDPYRIRGVGDGLVDSSASET